MTLLALTVNDLSIYPKVGLVVFFVVFIAVTVRALRTPRNQVRHLANLPLDDDTKAPTTDAHDEGSARA